jgi:hypothetical protein
MTIPNLSIVVVTKNIDENKCKSIKIINNRIQVLTLLMIFLNVLALK